ncbi:hypothetical protein [Actinomadura sp. HBU206391]|uniref:hypothetical protein n=1 Tax=Actinomadura sp. HBU206391 TaxID=2731692 RepID=UPI0016503AAD|nr:hypothetical protein [Actinomadura sp. HBU206391]MBC6461183.1 hypothetical protein [Actinomadura sp. HBU206391]
MNYHASAEDRFRWLYTEHRRGPVNIRWYVHSTHSAERTQGADRHHGATAYR